MNSDIGKTEPKETTVGAPESGETELLTSKLSEPSPSAGEFDDDCGDAGGNGKS